MPCLRLVNRAPAPAITPLATVPRFYPDILIGDCWASLGDKTFYHRNGKCYYRKRSHSRYPGTAAHLKEIVRLIREHNLTEKQVPIREPDQLIVLTGGTMAYTRQDGVKIIPLGCLKW